MRAESHIALGLYLSEHYMTDILPKYRSAFLLGCIEPDRNPLTYLKGSFRCQWLRGHNYRNARRFMRRISGRLETKDNWKLLDYYTLGKLIHYTADAFTYAHNEAFSDDLSKHLHYEAELQLHFLSYLKEDPSVDMVFADNVMEALSHFHREYEIHSGNIYADAWYALTACCCITSMLLTKPIF